MVDNYPNEANVFYLKIAGKVRGWQLPLVITINLIEYLK